MNYALTTSKVDLNQLARNILAVRRELSTEIMLLFVIKQDAYGHGLIKVARKAEQAGVDYLGVTAVEEALKLRRDCIKVPILLLGPPLLDQAEFILNNEIEVNISNLSLAKALHKRAIEANKSLNLHLNVNTGMGRSGLTPPDVGKFIAGLNQLSCFQIKGMFSHHTSAHINNQKGRQHTISQTKIFTNLLKQLKKNNSLPPIRHIAASDSLLRYREQTSTDPYNMVRIGELIYGANESLITSWPQPIKPVKSISTVLVDIFELAPNQPLSYGRTYITPSRKKIAMLPIGYAHGLDPRLSNEGEVVIEGVKAPIVGEICMNQTLVDVTDLNKVNVGDEVEIIGEHQTITEMAQKIGVSECEVLLSLTKMDERNFVPDN